MSIAKIHLKAKIHAKARQEENVRESERLEERMAEGGGGKETLHKMVMQSTTVECIEPHEKVQQK